MRCVIAGRVQMVGFRVFAVDVASQVGVSGWVRNLRDGAVEVLVQGPPERVEEVLRQLRRGPAAARVTSCEETKVPINDHLVGFRLVP